MLSALPRSRRKRASSANGLTSLILLLLLSCHQLSDHRGMLLIVMLLDTMMGKTLQVVQKVVLAMHAERTKKLKLRQRELKLLFFEFHRLCMMLLTSLRPVVPNERLYVDDRLFSHHFPLIKKTPENAVDKRASKACHVCFAKGKHTAKT